MCRHGWNHFCASCQHDNTTTDTVGSPATKQPECSSPGYDVVQAIEAEKAKTVLAKTLDFKKMIKWYQDVKTAFRCSWHWNFRRSIGARLKPPWNLSATGQSPYHQWIVADQLPNSRRSIAEQSPTNCRTVADQSPNSHRSIAEQSPINRRTVTDQLPNSHRPIAEQSPINRGTVADWSPIGRSKVARFQSQSVDEIDRRPIGDCSATDRRLIGDFQKTIATSLRSESVASILLCMFKRLAATNFVRRPISDLIATIIKLHRDFCNLSAIVIF